MRLAFVLPPTFLSGRLLDFTAIDTSSRGTTGTEIQILMTTKEMAKIGHRCDFFTPTPNVAVWEGVRLFDYESLWSMSEQYDAIVVSLDVNVLRRVSPKPLRVVWQQVNDFNYGAPGFENFVDLYVSPSQTHREMLERTWPSTAGKWEVVNNGCYPSEYEWADSSMRDSGYVAYISSPDRGLHLLLQEWPKIRRAAPHARLRIFYYSLQPWMDGFKGPPDPNWSALTKECHRRANYVRNALEAMEGFGIEAVGSISRAQLRAELRRVDVQAFPCDVVAWTESFSCATLEGCAAGALPIIARTNALGELFGDYTPSVPEPAGRHLDEWRELVIRAMTDREWADEWREKGRKRALQFHWRDVTAKFDKIVRERRK